MGLENWRQNMSTMSSLLLYSGKEKSKMELFYDGSWRGDLFLDSLEVNGRTNKWKQEGTQNCLMCRSRNEETLSTAW